MRFPPLRALGLLLLSAPAALAVACGDDDNANTSTTSDAGVADVLVVDAAPVDDGGVHTTAQILHVVKTINDGEIAAGNAAGAKATTTPAQEYAAMMVSMHTAGNQRGAALAQAKGVTPEDNAVSQKIASDNAAAAAMLAPLTGRDFDVAYLTAQLMAHQKAQAIVEQQLMPSATDADVSTELATTDATIKMHIQMAQRDLAILSGDAGSTM